MVQRAAGAEQLLRDVRVRPVHVVDVHAGEEARLEECRPVLGQWSGLGAFRRGRWIQDHYGRAGRGFDHQLARRRAGFDPTYGHVGIVESVDTAKGTITTSEKGAGYKVYSRTMPIRNGGTYVLPNDKLTGMGASGSSGTEQCVTGDDSTSDVSGDKASAADAKKIARRKLKDFGWDDSQFDCLDKLWTRESGWQWNATNPSSGAYGIPQSLPGSKMASAGQDWKTNAATQVKWGLGYIQQRYQSPCGAWAHSEATGWY